MTMSKQGCLSTFALTSDVPETVDFADCSRFLTDLSIFKGLGKDFSKSPTMLEAWSLSILPEGEAQCLPSRACIFQLIESAKASGSTTTPPVCREIGAHEQEQIKAACGCGALSLFSSIRLSEAIGSESCLPACPGPTATNLACCAYARRKS